MKHAAEVGALTVALGAAAPDVFRRHAGRPAPGQGIAKELCH